MMHGQKNIKLTNVAVYLKDKLQKFITSQYIQLYRALTYLFYIVLKNQLKTSSIF